MTRQYATHGGRRSRFAAVVLLGVAVCVAILPARANNYHECKHDSITHKLGTPPVVYVPTAAARTPYDDGLVDELAEPTAFPTPDPLADAGRAGFGNRTDDGDVRARRHLVGTFGSIRMFIDTSRLSNDPGFMCQVQGQTYTNTLDTSLSGVCTAADVMTAAKRTFLVDSVLASAKDYFARALQVESVVGNLVMPKNNDNWCASADFMCCGKNQPEQSYTTGYPDTDFVLWVTGRPTGGSTIAWALTCMTASGSVRPIAGHANFGPALINNDLGQQVSTAIHEVSHALGFSSSMFGLFRVPGTTTPRGSSNVMKSFTERGHTVRKIVTEEVVAKAKEQFDCPNWGLSAGGEVEDGGAAGTVGSHWEKRVYMNEYMTGTLNSHLPAVYSAMTLALFQDSGWYQVDYSVAEKLAWGNGQGCAFAQDYCSTWPSTYFCRQTNRGGCFPNLFYKGKCNFVDNEQLGGGKLTSWYRYFPESDYWGGISSVADHCPYYNVASGGDCRDSSNTDIRPLIGESAGVSSRCFTGTFARSDAHVSLKVYHAGCLRTTCDEFSQAIVVQLRRADHRATDYLDVTCPKSGTEAERTLDLAVVTSGEFDGTLICPPSTDVCTGNPCDTNTCSGHGTCQEAQDGVCLCQTNFYGDDAYHCDKVRCPTGPDGGGATVECSGHGTCQSDATQPNSGQCTCQTGYRSANCEERGCPQGPERTVCDAGGTNCRSEKTDCDGHGTCNTDTGECTCDAGYLPSDCVLTDCPKDGNGVYCYGNGNCDSTFGYCECKQTFSINATTGKEYVSRFFSGKDCATDNNGTSYPALYFTGEDAPSQFSVTNIDPSTGKAVPAAVTMNAEAYTYFSFNVESAAYQTELTLTWDDAGADPQMVACYAESCRQPTLHNAQFFVSTVDVALRKKVIVFVPDDTSPVAAAAFDRIGEMRVAIVSQTATTGTLSVTRDPCSFLQCVHGTCRNQKCVCDTPPSTVDGRYGGWSGALCDAPTCPGSPFACGDFRGRCEIEDPTLPTRNQFPVCRCNEGFTGVACSTTDTAGFSEVDASTPQTFSNVLDIGRNRTYFFSVKANDGILVELKSSTPDADPILLGQPGKVPPIVREAATAFDGPGWLQHKQNHTLSVGVVSDGIYFVRVINGRYATEPLAYTITFERHTDCSGGLNNCNGHGTCNKQCECGNGYEGIRCELAVPTLAKDSTTTVDVERGDWKYYVYKSTATAVEVEVKITGISVPAKAQPLLMVGATTQRRANNLRIITDESAYFDYDGFTSTTKDQTVTMRIKGVSFYFIGVHNTRNSWHDVKVALTVTERATPAFSGTGCGASAAATRQCEQQLCHGRGSYSTDANSHPFCVCESGWSTTTLCGTPRFTSFVNLLASAQEVGFLCNLCNFDIPMQENGLRVYKIPQPLQKATGLTIAATSANASQPGNPSLLVSEYLPRSIVDFRFVSSSSSSNETLKLTTQSPTGRYWLVVYANVEATYRVTAERESTPGQPLFSSTFMEELWDWVSNTNIGFVTAVVAGAIVLCLCIGCCWQVHQSGGVKGTAKQLRRNLSEVGTTLTDIRASSRHLVYRNAQPRSSQADNASAALSLQLAQIAQQAANERVAARGGAPVQHIRGAHSPAPAAPYQQMNQTPTRPPMPSAPPGHHSPMRPGGHHSPMPSPQFHGSPVPRPASQGYPQPQGYPQGGGYPQPGRSPHGNLPPVQRAQPPTRRR